MGQYGKAAISATKRICNGMDPVKAWNLSIKELTNSNDSIIKGCPKSAYLGFCEDGYVKGVNNGNYTTGTKNKGYALKAVEIIHRTPNRTFTKKELWAQVLDELGLPFKKENSHMDVVFSLHNEDLLIREASLG